RAIRWGSSGVGPSYGRWGDPVAGSPHPCGSLPLGLGVDEIHRAFELADRVDELQLAVLPLVDEEALALGEALLVPHEVAEDRAHRLLRRAGVQPLAQLEVVGGAGGPDRLLDALAHGERNRLVLVGRGAVGLGVVVHEV